jgi:hypothetical protein
MNHQESFRSSFGRRWPEVGNPNFFMGWPYLVLLMAALISCAKVSSKYVALIDSPGETVRLNR